MSEKMTVLNIRISLDEKNEIKDRAEKEGLSVSSYARNLLFSEDNTEDTQDNTVVIQEKDGRISDLKNQIDDSFSDTDFGLLLDIIKLPL
ncbi:plasmid mobilization protein [Streptococcus sp. FT1-106]|uniref:plasmid mobilization protein n=1 Tax=Streptococcus sp. FT1-106 TaxID=3409994 RepID=UPI003BF51A35